MLHKIFSLLIIILLLIPGCKRAEQPTEEANTDSNLVELNSIQLQQITVDTAKMEEERTDLVLSGKVSFNKDYMSPVYSFVSGIVLKVNVSLGDKVSKGEPLAILRSGDVSNYQGQYTVAQNQLKTAQRNLDIANELYKTKVYSEKDVMQAQNDYKSAIVTLQTVETYLKTYKVSSSDSNASYSISSPIDGYIMSKSVNEGMNIRADNTNPLFTISNLSTVWVEANVYENDIPQIAIGDSADISTVAYPDNKLKGIISKISNMLDSSASTMQARIALNNSAGLLKPGMFATVNVHIDKHKKAIGVPKESLIFYDNDYYVMVSKGDKKFEKRKISIDGTSEATAYVTKGLQPNEVVVSKNSLYVYGQ